MSYQIRRRIVWGAGAKKKAGSGRQGLRSERERESANLIRATKWRLIVFHADDIKIAAATQMRRREEKR